MAAELRFAPEAESDLALAYDWYESQRNGLGEEFVSCLDAAIASVCRLPESYEKVFEQFRRKLVRRFPFMLFYEYQPNIVTIYCIFHTSRDPGKWRQL